MLSAPGADETGWPTYRLYGVNLATNYPLAVRPQRVPAAADVRFEVVDEDPAGVDWSGADLRYATPVAAGRAEPDFRFFRLPDRDVIRLTGSADFHLTDRRIVCHLLAVEHAYLIEIALFGLVLAFWLERRGSATYHAAVVALARDAAVGFLAAGKTGKSAVAAELVCSGAPLVTEDLLVVSGDGPAPRAEPGIPQLRLWPETAARYISDWEQLDRPHPGFDKRRVPVGEGGVGVMSRDPVPLARLYVLDRATHTSGPPVIEALPARAALAELLRHSYLPHEAERFGWQPRRLRQMADLLHAVPVRRLRYPSDFDHLPAVAEAVRADLDSCGSDGRAGTPREIP